MPLDELFITRTWELPLAYHFLIYRDHSREEESGPNI